MTPRPPNAADEWRKHYATVRARLWATKPQQARVAKRTPDISPVPEPMPGPEQPEGTVDEVAGIWRQHDRLLGDAHLSIDAVIHVTAAYFHITVAELVSARRFGHLVRPRQVAVYLARALLCETKSTCQIGHHFHRDHATVIRACRQVAAKVATDAVFGEMVSTLRVYLARAEAQPELSDAIEAECQKILGNIATLRARIAGIEESGQ